jgi:hypothetical protein
MAWAASSLGAGLLSRGCGAASAAAEREQLPIGETVPEALFRRQLGEPHHYAYVVEDIEAIVNCLVDQLGAGPFFLIEGVPLENVRSRGEPAEFVHNSALAPAAAA